MAKQKIPQCGWDGDFDIKPGVLDVVHVEDNLIDREGFEKVVNQAKLTYHGCGCLEDLSRLFSCKFLGKIYIVDGQFPRKVGEGIEFLAPEAIDMIEEWHGYENGAFSYQILLHSSDSRCESIADSRMFVKYVNKAQSSHYSLLAKVNDILSGKS